MKKSLSSVLLGLSLVSGVATAGTAIQYTDTIWSENMTDVRLENFVSKGTKSYFVGYHDGMYYPYINMIASNTGDEVWNYAMSDVSGEFEEVVLIGAAVCAAGFADDDNGDGGNNVVVACFSASKGTLLWQKELEANDPAQDLDLRQIGGGKGLVLRLRDNSLGNGRIVVSFDPKTGTGLNLQPAVL